MPTTYKIPSVESLIEILIDIHDENFKLYAEQADTTKDTVFRVTGFTALGIKSKSILSLRTIGIATLTEKSFLKFAEETSKLGLYDFSKMSIETDQKVPITHIELDTLNRTILFTR
jgi:hypothetical protein